MSFIPPAPLILLNLYRSQNNRRVYEEQIKLKEIYESDLYEEKINLPYKCLTCDLKHSSYCHVKSQEIPSIPLKEINECHEMKKRNELKESSWTSINITLFKHLLKDSNEYSKNKFIYDNFDVLSSRLEIWQLLAILAGDPDSNIFVKNLITTRDYLDVFPSYIKIAEKIDTDDPDLSVRHINEKTEYNFATLLLLENVLIRYNKNENARIIQEMLGSVEKQEDIETIISLLYEEGFLPTTFDIPVSKSLKY